MLLLLFHIEFLFDELKCVTNSPRKFVSLSAQNLQLWKVFKNYFYLISRVLTIKLRELLPQHRTNCSQFMRPNHPTSWPWWTLPVPTTAGSSNDRPEVLSSHCQVFNKLLLLEKINFHFRAFWNVTVSYDIVKKYFQNVFFLSFSKFSYSFITS